MFTYTLYPIEQIIVLSFQLSFAPDMYINRHHVSRLVSAVTFPVHAIHIRKQVAKKKNMEKMDSVSEWERKYNVIVIISVDLLSERSDKSMQRIVFWLEQSGKAHENHAIQF